MQNNFWIIPAILSAIFAALVAVFGKIGLSGINVSVATMVRAAFMFLALFLFVLVTGKIGSLNAINNKALLYIVLAGVAGALSWLFYFWALRIGKVSHVAAIDRLSLVFAVALAAIFLGERLGWKTGLGALIMCGGAILIALG